MIEDGIYFDGPGKYLILIKEALDPEVFEMFTMQEIEGSWTTTSQKKQLLLNIKDQAELMGFLNFLYEHHYTILRVESVGIPDSDHAY